MPRPPTGAQPEVFVDPTTPAGVQQVRRYTLAWLERLDYAGKLDRGWEPEELGALVWARLEGEYAVAWEGRVVSNRPLAEIAAASMVEDYWAAFPERRGSRYIVGGELGEVEFRRCVLDWVHDLEEFEPELLTTDAEATAARFWADVAERPERWGYRAEHGPLLDDVELAREVALDAIRGYYRMQRRLAALRTG